MLALLFLGLKLIILLTIAIQDIKTRKISVFLFGVLFLVNLIDMSIKTSVIQVILFTVKNSGLTLLIFGLTFSYFKWIRRIKHPLSSHFGWGDILFFLALTPLFIPFTFSLLFIGLTALSLIIGITLLLFKKTKDNTIPFAGIAAIGFIILLVLFETTSLDLNLVI